MVSNMTQDKPLRKLSEYMLDLISEKDELVPGWMGTGVLNAAESKGRLSVIVRDALHENAWEKR